MQPIVHVSFDLDGVLVDSLHVMSHAWEVACSEIGLDIPFDVGYRKCIGRPFPEILEELSVPKPMRETLRARYFQVTQEKEDLVYLYPDVAEGVSELNEMGTALSIVTSKPLERAKSLLHSLLPDTNWILVSPELLEPGRGKPAPDGLRLAASLHDVSPEQSLFVGDMDVDFLAARSAGFSYLHAVWGYGEAVEGAREVSHFRSISDLVRASKSNGQ